MAITPCTPEDVRAVTGLTLTDEQMQPFIDAAVLILEQVEPCMIGKGISEETKTYASAYLAAHLLSLSPIGSSANTKTTEKFENYSVSYAVGSYTASGVLATPYGNVSNAMSGGCLQEVDKRNSGIAFFGGA